MKNTETAYLMLGGNMGDRMAYLARCEEALRLDAGEVTALSQIYESEPWGFDDPACFLNRVVVLETALLPHALLQTLQKIEQMLGRVRLSGGYHSRTMDIDILLYGRYIIHTPQLTVPHPRMTERRFVLQPMAEIAAEMQHPVLLQTMRQLLEECRDERKVWLMEKQV